MHFDTKVYLLTCIGNIITIKISYAPFYNVSQNDMIIIVIIYYKKMRKKYYDIQNKNNYDTFGLRSRWWNFTLFTCVFFTCFFLSENMKIYKYLTFSLHTRRFVMEYFVAFTCTYSCFFFVFFFLFQQATTS